MTVYVVDAHAHVQRLVSVVNMATMLEGVLPKSRVLLCFFVCKRTQSVCPICAKNAVETTGDSLLFVEKIRRERKKRDTGENSSLSQAPEKKRQLRMKPVRDVDDFNATAIRKICKTFTGQGIECQSSAVSNL
jgi:hypothetical protein